MERATGFLAALGFVVLVVVGSANAVPINYDSFLIPVTVIEGSYSQTLNFDTTPIYSDDGKEGIIGFKNEGNQILTFDNGDTVYSPGFQSLFDPVINASIGVVDNGAPSGFSFTFVAPLAPSINLPAVGRLDIEGSFADGASDGGSATPLFTSAIAQATIEGSGVADAGPAATFNPGVDVYGPFSSTYNFDCTLLPDGQCDSFDLQISFTGSGGGDSYSFSARHEINPVPEPATLFLLGSGFLGLMGFGRKKFLKK
jgi:hypothetical protein